MDYGVLRFLFFPPKYYISFFPVSGSRRKASSAFLNALSHQKVVLNVPYIGRLRLSTNMFYKSYNSSPTNSKQMLESQVYILKKTEIIKPIISRKIFF